MDHLRVLTAGPLTTVQDMGRLGYARFGVPRSGPMDWFALRAANQLVSNPIGAAGLEFALEAPALQAEADCLIAAAGWGWYLTVQGRRVGLWRAALVFRGETIRFQPAEGVTPGWGYLAVRGGIAVPPVMGSRSTYLRGGFGGWQGRVLRPEDALPLGELPQGRWKHLAGRYLPQGKRPAYSPQEKRPAYSNSAIGSVTIPVILGPQAEAFPLEAREVFLSAEYTVSATSDRMGYRLSGPRLEHAGQVELISEPIPWGAVQVPANSQPIVMMSDQQTAGGYPKIATVTLAGLPLLAQAMPGSGRVRFAEISLEAAQAGYRALVGGIERGVEDAEDEGMFSSTGSQNSM